jgi:hypothetical protein
MRTVVVLPALLGPSSAKTLPRVTRRSTPASTLVWPYDFCRPTASTAKSVVIVIRGASSGLA